MLPPNITDANWERVEDAPPEVTWIIRVTLVDPDLRPRAAPLLGQVGDVPIEALAVGAGEAVGFLSDEPPVGAAVSVRWLDGELVETDVTFPGLPVG